MTDLARVDATEQARLVRVAAQPEKACPGPHGVPPVSSD